MYISLRICCNIFAAEQIYSREELGETFLKLKENNRLLSYKCILSKGNDPELFHKIKKVNGFLSSFSCTQKKINKKIKKK